MASCAAATVCDVDDVDDDELLSFDVVLINPSTMVSKSSNSFVFEDDEDVDDVDVDVDEDDGA